MASNEEEPRDVESQDDDITADEADVVASDHDAETLDDADVDAAEEPVAPVKRNQTVAPVRKSKPASKKSETHTEERTTPGKFVRQSIDELKKVHWPDAPTVRQYFILVLVFVLIMMGIIAGLDALFGWLTLKLLG